MTNAPDGPGAGTPTLTAQTLDVEISPSEQRDAALVWSTQSELTEDGEPARPRARKAPLPWLLLSSIVIAIIWVGSAGLILLEANAGGQPPDLMQLVGQLLGPAAVVILAGFLGETMAKSNRMTQALLQAERRMLDPDRTGAKLARTTSDTVRNELRRLESIVTDVAGRLQQIEVVLSSRTDALNAAGERARTEAETLARTMQSERDQFDALVRTLSALQAGARDSAGNVADGLQSRVEELDETARRLDAAARRAAETVDLLDQAAVRGEQVLVRTQDVMVLARASANDAVGAVASSVDALRDAAAAASQSARQTTEIVAREASQTRNATLRILDEIRAAAEGHARDMAAALRGEAAAARTAGEEAAAALQVSAQTVRHAADEARLAAAQEHDENQARLAAIRQTVFDADRAAHGFADQRISEAQALIERSAGLLEETASRIHSRFEQVAAACSDQARGVEDVVAGLQRQIAALPAEADQRARAIEAALSDTLRRLQDAGRRAAQETADLDAAFQTRLRDSYSALGELVQRLGGLSGLVTPSSSLPADPRRTPPGAEAQAASGPGPHSTISAPSRPEDTDRPASPPISRPKEPAAAVVDTDPTMATSAPVVGHSASEPTASEGSLSSPGSQPPQPAPSPSGRLRITSPMPVEDDPFAELQRHQSRGGLQRERDWSWKQVLSTLDARGQEEDGRRLERLAHEVGLAVAIDDPMLERWRALATRARADARAAVRSEATDRVRALRETASNSPELRAALARFVEARREAAARGRMGGLEARLYFVADAALEA